VAPVGVPVKRNAKLKPLNGGRKAPLGARLHLFAPHIDAANKVLARGLNPHGLLALVKSADDVDKSFSDVKDKAGKKLRQAKGSLKTRTDQALHPPSVKLKPVRSSAVSEMGYQPQTRRLAYQLRSNPGQQYTYKVPVTEGVSALSAESKGRHYATKVARKAKRSDAVSPVDRARLFVHPDVSKRGRS
jgi:hypothetical protein